MARELARAIAARPILLLADEPCAGLNPTETAAMIEVLRKVRASGVTVVGIGLSLSIPLLSIEMERRGGKDMCPNCHYIQPCCDGGFCPV